MIVSLTTRLSAFFLLAIAVVLTGFSATVFLLAQSYLFRQLDERLLAAINTLSAIAEIEETCVEWDTHDRHLQIGDEFSETSIIWTVHGDGRLIDASDNLRGKDVLRRDLEPAESTSGFLSEKLLGEDRRGLRRELTVETPQTQKPDSRKCYGKLVLTVTTSEKPVHVLLGRLAVVLAVASSCVWALAFVAGRWFCRRALRPVTEMAEQARTMNAESPDERLALSHTGDELEALGHSFNGLLDRLHEALERQRRFTGDASHQLRTPLAALLGQIEVALRHPRSAEEYQKTLERVQHQGQHLHRIVEMLLYLARADAEARLENVTPLDLTGWLTTHLQTWTSQPRWGDIQLLQPLPAHCLVKAHQPLLGQLLDNLIDNALKYSTAGTPVTIRLECVNGKAVLEVHDRGMGIDPTELLHIFEPFYRSESARSQGLIGIGLGLSIAQRIAHLFGGSLSASSTLGQGSRFTLILPLLSEGPPAS